MKYLQPRFELVDLCWWTCAVDLCCVRKSRKVDTLKLEKCTPVEEAELKFKSGHRGIEKLAK